MLRIITLVIGMLVYTAGCTETAPVDEASESTQADEATQAEDAIEISAVVDSSEVLPSAETFMITITGDGTESEGTSGNQVITVQAPSRNFEPVYLTSEKTTSMNLPFSDAVRVGNMLYLSGQIGNVPGTLGLAPGGIKAETAQTMENIKAVLEANGSSLDRVIKATVMLADIAEWPAFNEVYVTYFPGPKPARSAFAGSGLAMGARCEVEVIAVVGE